MRRLLAAKIGASVFEHNTGIIFVGQDCVDHQCHLPVKTGLLLIDGILQEENQDWRYFGSVAKCINGWRDSATSVPSMGINLWSYPSFHERT